MPQWSYVVIACEFFYFEIKLATDAKDSDSITKWQDFYISPVSARMGLYVAFGGSFHGWKFLTNIGSYIVQMMDGDEAFSKEWNRWAGLKGGGPQLVHGDVIPRRTLLEA